MRSFTVIALFFAAYAAANDYNGYRVYDVQANSDDQLKLLSEIRGNNQLDFWTRLHTPNVPISVMVAPSAQSWFESFLHQHQISHKVLIENVASTIAAETARQRAAPAVKAGDVTFTSYMRHDEINAYLTKLAAANSKVASTIKIGTSYEGRDMLLLKISSGGSGKPAIFVDAGIHAREWIAPPVALYIINQLVENSTNAEMLSSVDWYVIPSINPDGYEYTHTSERFWRKSRSPNSISYCPGTDPNRNFGFHWMETGASDYACDETYAGKKAFSEVETSAVRDFLLATENIKLYLTFHSYGQYLLYPWGYTSALPSDAATLKQLAVSVNNAIKAVAGTTYTIGSSTNVLYAAAGGSDDWAKGVGNISLSYTIELPGGGSGGFNPPASKIVPVVTETWEGIKAYHKYIQDTFASK